MNLSTDVAKFALSNTDDPELAARLADLLSDDMLSATPKVAFPPAWVIAKQKSNAKVASYAIANCDDPATLAAILPKAKRQSVLYAMASNPHLSDATAADLLVVVSNSGDYKTRQALSRRSEIRKTPETLANYLVRAVDDPSLLGEQHRPVITRTITAAPCTPADIDQLVTSTVLHGETWAVEDVFYSRYQAPAKGGIGSCTLTQEAMVDLLDLSLQVDVLRRLLGKLLNTLAIHATIPLGLAEQITSRVDPKAIDAARMRTKPSTFNVFSPEALDHMLDYPGWEKILYRHDLTATQLERLLPGLDANKKMDLIGLQRGNRERFELVFETLEGELALGNLSHVQTILEFLSGTDDPLFPRVLAMATPVTQMEYLVGAWKSGSTLFLPTFDEVDRLVAEIGPDILSSIQPKSLTSTELPDEYVLKLADAFPSASHKMLRRKPVAEHTYVRLSTCGGSIEMALDQYSSNPGASLDDICNVIHRMSRLSS